MSLPVSRLIRVAINLSPLAAAQRSFGVLLVAGDSSVINPVERLRSYATYDGVAEDFGVDAPEALAAQLYFGQTPQPSQMMVGRWVRTASAAQNIGGIMTATQQQISNWNSITNGAVQININGTGHSLTALDFSAQTNLNGVANVITTALSGAGTVTWDGESFTVTSGTTGAGSQATGMISFSAAPAPNDTVTLNGLTLTFVASSPSSDEILIGGNAISSAANLQAYLQTSTEADLIVANYSTANGITTITYKTIGTTGNSYTLAKSSSAISLSGGDLAGGTVASVVGFATAGASGTDVSAQLLLTSSTNIALIPGFAAETPAQCAEILCDQSTAWYGLQFAASVQPTDDQSIDVSGVIEAQDLKRVYGVTITSANVLSSLVTTDLASRMSAAGYLQSCCQYSSSSIYAIASFFGRAFSVNFNGNNTTITLMYKQEPGISGEELTTDQANVLQAKRCNVFVDYVNDTMIIQYGVMSGSAYFDEIHGLDWFQDEVQTAVYNLLYTSTTKIPQTDSGVNQLVNAIGGACDQAVSNGLAAPGTWTGPSFGTLVSGQYLKLGYYIYSQPLALQSQADREARKAPPIQIALKLAGAIQEADIIIQVNR